MQGRAVSNMWPWASGTNSPSGWDLQMYSFWGPISLSSDALIQIRSNQMELEKKPGLMGASVPGWPSDPQRRKTRKTWGAERRTRKATCSFSGASLNNLWEWTWPSLWRGHHLAGFLIGGAWTVTTPRGGAWNRSFPPKHSRMDARGLSEAWTQISCPFTV